MHTRFPSPSLSPEAYSNSLPLSQQYHPTISSSVVPFSSCIWYFPLSETFLMSWLFTSSDQSTKAWASALVLTSYIQDCFFFRFNGFISLSATVSIVYPSMHHEVMGPNITVLVFWNSPLSFSTRSSFNQLLFTFCHKIGVICIPEFIDISPYNLDSSLCFQPCFMPDVLFM